MFLHNHDHKRIFGDKNISMFEKTTFYVPEKTVWGEIFFCQKKSVFGAGQLDLNQLFGTFGNKFSVTILKMLFPNTAEQSDVEKLTTIGHFFVFWFLRQLRENIVLIVRKILVGLTKLPFTCSGALFEVYLPLESKLRFSKFSDFRKTFRFSANSY